MMTFDPKTLELEYVMQPNQTSNQLKYNPFQLSSMANYLTTTTGDTDAICGIMKNNTIIIDKIE